MTTGNYGRNTPEGFVPGEPGLDGLLKKLGVGGGGWDDLNTPAASDLETNRKNAENKLKQAYASVLSSADGRLILEDIMDQSLRRAPAKPGKDFNLEQQSVYILERMGQNGLATYILKMIVDGLEQRKASAGKTKTKRT
jgi:hypothetical protein